jgi:hypothetical protein
MLKFLLLAILFFYITYKALGFVFRLIGTTMGNPGASQNSQRHSKRGKGKAGNISVDYVPKGSKKEHLKGGEYIDFEEVKED